MEQCIFCNYSNNKNEKVLFENDLCVCLNQYFESVLIGSCIIIPKAHKETVFDLSNEEWDATKQLLDKVKSYLDDKYKPDGYNVGWNCGAAGGQDVFHAHLHIIPRHADEPRAGNGIRHWIKQKENMRPNSNNKYARNGRATGIVLRDNKIMFMQQMVSGKLRHIFVGGGIEENETPEQAVLRELKEEANVDGKVIYGPVYIPSKELNHEYFFLLSINDDQMPMLGYDPEIPKDEEQVLKGVVWRDIDKEHDRFTAIDKNYISILTTHATEHNIQADWLKSLLKILSTEVVMETISFKKNIERKGL